MFCIRCYRGPLLFSLCHPMSSKYSLKRPLLLWNWWDSISSVHPMLITLFFKHSHFQKKDNVQQSCAMCHCSYYACTLFVSVVFIIWWRRTCILFWRKQQWVFMDFTRLQQCWMWCKYCWRNEINFSNRYWYSSLCMFCVECMDGDVRKRVYISVHILFSKQFDR